MHCHSLDEDTTCTCRWRPRSYLRACEGILLELPRQGGGRVRAAGRATPCICVRLHSFQSKGCPGAVPGWQWRDTSSSIPCRSRGHMAECTTRHSSRIPGKAHTLSPHAQVTRMPLIRSWRALYNLGHCLCSVGPLPSSMTLPLSHTHCLPLPLSISRAPLQLSTSSGGGDPRQRSRRGQAPPAAPLQSAAAVSP